MSVRIATSMRGGMRALASQGIFATDCYDQLHTLVLRRLGEDHAALLAEPQHNSQNDSVDWYAAGQSPARPLAELPPEEADALRARAGELARDIRNLAAGLTTDAQARQALAGHMLRLALQHPEPEDLWCVDGRPVLINWGFAPSSGSAQPQDLTRLGPAAPPPRLPVAPAPAVAASGCLSWLLPLLLLLLLLWLLSAALGLLPSPLPSGCTPADRTALTAEEQKSAALDEELALLWRQLQERAAQCRPVTPPVATKTPEPETPEPEVVTPFFGETPETPPEPVKPGEQPKPRAQPKPQPAPPRPVEQPKPQKKRNEDLTIPQDAAKKKDLSFLEGCWSSETGLYSHPSREPIVAEYCFDKNGKGRRFVRERNGQVCSGTATARFQGSNLQFESGQARCPRGGTYVPQKVRCTGSENSTQCKGKELGGANLQWNARFKRK